MNHLEMCTNFANTGAMLKCAPASTLHYKAEVVSHIALFLGFVRGGGHLMEFVRGGLFETRRMNP